MDDNKSSFFVKIAMSSLLLNKNIQQTQNTINDGGGLSPMRNLKIFQEKAQTTDLESGQVVTLT